MCIRSYLLAHRQDAPKQFVYYSSVSILAAVSQGICLGCRILLFFIQELFRSLLLVNGCFLPPDDLKDSSPSKPPTSRRAKNKKKPYPQDVQSDQLQRAVVLGPPSSPQGAKCGSQEQKDDQLKKLEKRLEELALMLDMVKTQVHTAHQINQNRKVK